VRRLGIVGEDVWIEAKDKENVRKSEVFRTAFSSFSVFHSIVVVGEP
jgi:hypothetical protein